MPSSAPPEPFDGPAILEVLIRHGVDFVVIGGFAATLHGSPFVTFDLDVTPKVEPANYARLSAALSELEAKVRADGTDPLPFDHDAESLANVSVWNLSTKFGELDITITPSGTAGYGDLRRDALVVRLRSLDVVIACLADVVRSKDAAGRNKDRLVLPVLRELVADQTRADAEIRRRGPREPL